MSHWQYHWDDDGERTAPTTHRRYTSYGDELLAFGWNDPEPDMTDHDKLHAANAADAAAVREATRQARIDQLERARMVRYTGRTP